MSWLGDVTCFLWKTGGIGRLTTAYLKTLLRGTDFKLTNPDTGKIEILINEPCRSVDSVDCEDCNTANHLLEDDSITNLTVRLWLDNGTDVNFRFVYTKLSTLVFASGMLRGDCRELAQLQMAFEREFYRCYAEGKALGLVIGSPSTTYVDGVFQVDEWFHTGGEFALPLPDLVVLPFPLARSLIVDNREAIRTSLCNGWMRIARRKYVSLDSTKRNRDRTNG